ncbi:F-box domain protein [Penicillium hispanicum]|uniref:F-box domain protein n=1 Tax=Penicillium hispanicum TaxID=1080232 RepID=UPI0025402618|nr:F-box domain protein [Penicillium hispanicum]KAJ5585278.1 F-box domain protein [Penicillium hispanicum]
MRDPCMILSLPEELLIEILEWSTLYAPGTNHLRGLALVCPRFYYIVTPWIFREINLLLIEREPTVKSAFTLQALQLCECLCSNPSLRSLCHSLRIDFDTNVRIYPDDLKVANVLFSGMTNVRSFTLRGDFRRPFNDSVFDKRQFFWALIQRASQNLVNLKEFILGDIRGSFNVGPLLSDAACHIHMPFLETLDIWNAVYLGPTETPEEIKQENYRSAPFTTVTLRSYEGDRESLRRFLNWPKKIVHLCIDTNYDLGWVDRRDVVDLPWLVACLAPHKDTVESISLGPHIPNETGLFDATGFSKLTFLRIAGKSLGSPGTSDLVWPHEDLSCDMLLAPNLETLELSYGVFHPLFNNDFDEWAQHWIRQLADAICNSSSRVKIQLRLVSGEGVKPTFSFHSAYLKYPWDYLEGLQKDLQRQGVILEYDQPIMTREKWTRRLIDKTWPRAGEDHLEHPQN